MIIRVLTLLATMAIATAAYGQSIAAGGPFSPVPVLNAPFSADAVTTVRAILPDGTPRVDTWKARYYRDSQGRVRADLETPTAPYVVVEIPGGTPAPFLRLRLDKKTFEVFPGHRWAARLFNAEGSPTIPLGGPCFHHELSAVLANASDDERLRAVHGQISPDLHIITESHRADSVATVDYTVTNIRRDEPPAELFDLTEYRWLQSTSDDPLLVFPSLSTPYSCPPRSR